MRHYSFMFPYVRAHASKSVEMLEFTALDALMSNELQLFYLFVKWSEVSK